MQRTLLGHDGLLGWKVSVQCRVWEFPQAATSLLPHDGQQSLERRHVEFTVGFTRTPGHEARSQKPAKAMKTVWLVSPTALYQTGPTTPTQQLVGYREEKLRGVSLLHRGV